MMEFLDGNEAVCRGAVQAGCNFFAGYPITPASSILQIMLDVLPRHGGVGLQAEDEIAAIGSCIGAAMAGKRAMTASSGPGLSLYSENIGLAMMMETPLVIVHVQRQGPATGSATKGAEGDILFTRWGTSGGLPIIALSPTDVLDSFVLSYQAFLYAERFRCPVFLLSSKEVALTRETVDLSSHKLPDFVPRVLHQTGLYRPHAFELPHEVPAMAHVGDSFICRYTTSMHDQAGRLTTQPREIQAMVEHLAAKITAAADDIAWVESDLQAGAETLVISYGVVARSVADAVHQWRQQGRAVSSLVIKSLFPVPAKQIVKAMQGVKQVLVPEMNLGQYILEIERLAADDTNVTGLHKMDTTLITPHEILASLACLT